MHIGINFPLQDCGGICNPTSLKLGSIREGNESRDFFRIADIQIAPWCIRFKEYQGANMIHF